MADNFCKHYGHPSADKVQVSESVSGGEKWNKLPHLSSTLEPLPLCTFNVGLAASGPPFFFVFYKVSQS